MQAVRKFIKPDEHGQIVINLPADFRTEIVEVIVLRYDGQADSETVGSEQELTDEQKLLVAFPVATADDLSFIDDKRKHFNQQIIKTLPVSQLNKLKTEIEQNTRITDVNTDLESLLLNGPVATQKQLDTIDANREAINQWRTK
jgi:hypothetical protein